MIAIIAVEGRDEGMFPYGLETCRPELEEEVAMQLFKCSLLAAISFARLREGR